MCNPMLIAGGVQVAGGAMTAQSIVDSGKSSLEYYRYMAANNERAAKSVTDQAVEQGNLLQGATDRQVGYTQDTAGRTAADLKVKTNAVLAKQRASMAAAGVGLDSGTVSDLVSDTVNRSNADDMAIRYTADLQSYELNRDATQKKSTMLTDATNKAFELRTQAGQYLTAGKNDMDAANTKAITSLLGTGTSVASQWMQYGKTSGVKKS
jgi:hypothetical protein